MKKLIIICSTFICLNVEAQQINPFPKTINVTGSAEMEIVPDEIYVQVDLKEYQKKNEKMAIDKIKSDFISNIRSLGIPDSLVSIASYEGDNDSESAWWRKKKRAKDEDLLASISYQIKLNSSSQVDKLVNILDDEATANFKVIRTSHSRINEFRKQLKIQAVKAAREKANYLADAINERVGEAVTINEPDEVWLNPGGYYYLNNKLANSVTTMGHETGEQGPLDFKKITLKYQVNAIFALK